MQGKLLGRRTSVVRRAGRALLATGLACAATVAAPATASAEVKLVAEVKPDAPSKLELTALAPRSSKRVTFYVDGEKRWTDASPRWEFGPAGSLSAAQMQPGEHVVTTRVLDRKRRVTAATRTVLLTQDEGGARWQTSLVPSTSPSPGAGSAETTPDPEPTPGPASDPPAPPVAALPSLLTEAGFENGFTGVSMAGVGDVQPTIATDAARTGSSSAKVVLTGSQDRSEMIVADNRNNTISFTEGQERYYGFSFLVESMQYGRPGAHNLITQLKSDGDGSPAFGLALWDFEGKRGLWSHGSAAGGDHFLAPIAHDAWNDVVVHFKASRTGQGFYEIFLNGQLIDSRQGINTILPDRTSAYLKTGLYRNGGQIPGISELRYDSLSLGTTAAQVTP